MAGRLDSGNPMTTKKTLASKRPPKPKPAKTLALRPTTEEQRVFCALRAGGMTQEAAIAHLRPHLTPQSQRQLGQDWERGNKALIDSMRRAAANAAALVHGVTKASQIGWLLKVRDAKLSDVTPDSPAAQRYTVTQRYGNGGNNVKCVTTTVELPSRLAANDQINKILDLYGPEPEADPTPGLGQAKDTLADLMRTLVRPGMPTAHRKADVEAGRIIEATVTKVRPTTKPKKK